MRSMTGFGRAVAKTKQGQYLVEISGVNNRYLECGVRLPKQFSSLEPRVRELVSSTIERGKVNVYISFERSDLASSALKISEATLQDYHSQLQRVSKKLKLASDIPLASLLSLPEVVMTGKESYDEEGVWKEMKKGVGAALDAFQSMRETEGKAMAADMARRISSVTKMLQQVEKHAPEAVQEYRAKLRSRIEELLAGQQLDTIRLETEVAIFAERCDVTEECVRLASHLKQFSQAVRGSESAGKRLNFILQEMNREVNTISSKTTDLNITNLTISMKEEIEKVRELVQNIE